MQDDAYLEKIIELHRNSSISDKTLTLYSIEKQLYYTYNIIQKDWHSEEEYNYILSHCKCVAEIVSLLYSDLCLIDKKSLVAAAFMHDCMKFAKFNDKQLFEVKSLHSLQAPMPKQMTKGSIHLQKWYTGTHCVNTLYLETYYKIKQYIHNISTVYSKNREIDILNIAALSHMTVADKPLLDTIERVKLTVLADSEVEDNKINIEIYDIYIAALKSTLLVTIADVLDACTRENGTKNTLDKAPKQNRVVLFNEKISVIIEQLKKLDENTYGRCFIKHIIYALEQLPEYTTIIEMAHIHFRKCKIPEYILEPVNKVDRT